jgi:hypothetical protein
MRPSTALVGEDGVDMESVPSVDTLKQRAEAWKLLFMPQFPLVTEA